MPYLQMDGATGIDGVTVADYASPTLERTKRPLGIPTFEDKVAQRAILMLLEPIYEADFRAALRRERAGLEKLVRDPQPGRIGCGDC